MQIEIEKVETSNIFCFHISSLYLYFMEIACFLKTTVNGQFFHKFNVKNVPLCKNMLN